MNKYRIAGVIVSLMLMATYTQTARAQIGGKTGFDGTFVLEDVENVDLFCDSVGRYWLTTNLYGHGNILTTQTLSGSGLTLAPGQSPFGYFKATVPEYYSFLQGDFGVPMPAHVGASTLTSPGDISSFGEFTFLACYSNDEANLEFQVILECYPETSPGTFPKLYWIFQPAIGTTFQKITLDLRKPDAMSNTGNLTVEQLLAQTRFLDFYIFAGPVPPFRSVTLNIDDIRLEPPLSAHHWNLYQ